MSAEYVAAVGLFVPVNQMEPDVSALVLLQGDELDGLLPAQVGHRYGLIMPLASEEDYIPEVVIDLDWITSAAAKIGRKYIMKRHGWQYGAPQIVLYEQPEDGAPVETDPMRLDSAIYAQVPG